MKAPVLLAAIVLLASACLGGCSHDYTVERRDTPVHVWLSAPELAAQGGTLHALIYVAGSKIVDGPVTFAPGHATVALPTAHVRAGPAPVSAVLGDGAISVSDRIEIEGESWIQVTVRGKGATIRASEDQPSAVVR